jgi:hypothetical protein
MKRLFASLLLLLYSIPSLAQIRFDDAVTPELVTSARARAMGNAFISKVDDSASSFYNPAGLGTVRKTHFHLSNFHFEGNKGWVEAGLGGKAFSALSKFSKGLSVDGVRELLQDKPGIISYNRFQIMPNFTTRYFSLGYMVSSQTKAIIANRDDGTQVFDYAVRRDHGPYASLNISFWGGILKLGMTGTLLQRREQDGSVDPTVAITLEDNDYRKGSTVHIVSGGKLTLPITYLPTFSVVSHNTFQNDFSSRAAGAPAMIEPTMDLGFSVTPQIGDVTRMHLEVNYKDFGANISGVPMKRRIAIGAEFDVARTFFLRLGYGDGYGSLGMGVRAQRFEVDLSTYAVATSGRQFAKKEDRRFALSLSSGF